MNRFYNNFDFIRFVAALLVIITHAYPLTGRPEANDPLTRLTYGTTSFSYLAVRVFFIISGFLICLSLLKAKTYKEYFIKRCLRIFPGLVVVVFVSAFIMGPAVTTLPSLGYLQSSGAYKYLLNIFLYPLDFFLPGVFEKNPFGGVINGSLWTLKYEFTLYIILAFLLFLRLLDKFRFGLILLSVIFFRLFLYEQQKLYKIPYLELNVKLMVDFTIYFFTGTFFYLCGDQIKDKFNLSILVIATALWIVSFGTMFAPLCNYFFFPIITFYIAFLPGSLNHFSKRGDFSYGIYIYAYPVAQFLIYFTKNRLSVMWLVTLTTIITLCFAFLSWHLVEKKFLRLKTKIG